MGMGMGVSMKEATRLPPFPSAIAAAVAIVASRRVPSQPVGASAAYHPFTSSAVV